MNSQVSPTIDLNNIINTPNQDYIYRIPEYQREYVWGKEQISHLINDFIDPQNPLQNKAHFIGTISRCRINPVAGTQGTGCNEAYLIDGQQRFTTLLLFVHAIDTILERNHQATEANYTNTKNTINRLLYCSGTQYRRLYLNDLNQNYYSNVICRYHSNNEVITKKSQKNTENEGLEIVFYTIYSTLKEYYTNAGSTIDFLSAFLEKLITDLEFSIIDVISIINSPRIFETLNFRGKELVACELIKNRVLLNISTDAQRDDYIDKWTSISRKLKTSASFDDYIRFTYLAIKGNVTNKTLTQNVLDKWIKDDSTITKKFVDTLEKNIDIYLYFSDRSNRSLPQSVVVTTDQKTQFEWLRDDYLRLNLCKPYRAAIIKASELGANAQQLLHIASVGFNFFFRKMVIMKDKLNSFIAVLNEKILAANSIQVLEQSLSSFFISKAPDNDFYNALTAYEFDTYSESKSTVGYTMIWRFESQNFGTALASVTRSNVDIEHVFPRKYKKHWSDDVIKGKISENDLLKLGNLILLENNLNSSIGNLYYNDKVVPQKKGKTKKINGKFFYYQHGKKKQNGGLIPPTVLPVAKSLSNGGINWDSAKIDSRTSEIINGCIINSIKYLGLKDLFPLN